MSVMHRRQLGLGLVELMVGITVGLIVAAGASLIAVNQINEHRRLMLETQVQQDLRTAADLLQQDLRRAGFRGPAPVGVWAPAKAVGGVMEHPPETATVNQFTDITQDESGTAVNYSYAREDPKTGKWSLAPGAPKSNEKFGFRWNRKVLYLQLGFKDDGEANWQPITDPEVLLIDDFKIDVVDKAGDLGDLGDFCDKTCSSKAVPIAGKSACPTREVREVTFQIVGRAKHDASIVRKLEGKERIRADVLTGECPA